MDCSPPGSSVHEIFQARILEWVAISFSTGSSQPRDRTRNSCTAGRFFTDWAKREAHSHSTTYELKTCKIFLKCLLLQSWPWMEWHLVLSPFIFHMTTILPGTQETKIFERINEWGLQILASKICHSIHLYNTQRSKQMNFPGCLEMELEGKKWSQAKTRRKKHGRMKSFRYLLCLCCCCCL